MPCWSCLCLSPALFFRPPLACSLVRAKSVQCWLCQVNYFHPCGAFAACVAKTGLWRARDEPWAPAAARLLPPWTRLEGSAGPAVQTPRHSRPFCEGAGWEKEPCLTAELGFSELESYFIKSKSQKKPPSLWRWGWMSWLFVTVLKTLE